jgi:aspartate/methionine/tyrosine aminotransferase
MSDSRVDAHGVRSRPENSPFRGPAGWPGTWAPYMTWAKHQSKARLDLTGSNLLPCTFDDLPGAREAMELYGRNDDGWPPLVRAVAERYGVPEGRVATATGASGANFLALAAVLRPGDTLLAEWPGYDPHMGAAHFLGASVNTFDRGWARGFALDPGAVEKALTPETRAIILTNLHNPSGVYAGPEALSAVGELARGVGAKVIVDEVYLDALQDVDRSPAATRDDVFISTNSLTKSYGLAGVRVGWMLADAEITERALRVRDIVDAVGSIPSESIGVLAFRRLDHLLERARRVLGPGSALFRDFVESRGELQWIPPLGGSVGFPRLMGADDAEPFVDSAAAEFGVGVTPGRLFGAPEHFRVAVAGEFDVLEQGLEQLGRALDAWSG